MKILFRALAVLCVVVFVGACAIPIEEPAPTPEPTATPTPGPTPAPTPEPTGLVTTPAPDNPSAAFGGWGGRIALNEYGGSGSSSGDLWVITVDAQPLLVAHGAAAGHSVRWSPDGKYLAYTQQYSDNTWRTHITAGNATLAYIGQKSDEQISWLPDSSRLLMGVYADGALFGLGVDGAFDVDFHLWYTFTYSHNPVPFPGGNRIAFVHHEWGTHGSVYVIPIETFLYNHDIGKDYKILEMKTAFDEPVQLEIRKDDTIIMAHQDEETAGIRVSIVDPVSGTTRYSRNQRITYVRLSPNRQFAAFLENKENRIVIQPDDLTTTLYTITPASSSENIHTFAWSPGSDMLAVATENRVYLWRMDTRLWVQVYHRATSDVASTPVSTFAGVLGEEYSSLDWTNDRR